MKRFQAEPGSLQARASHDRELQRRIREGRQRAREEWGLFERWARIGFTSWGR